MAVRIDFLQLDDDQLLLAVFQLARHGYAQNRKICIWADSRQQAEQLDELLWSAEAELFLPHHLIGDGPSPPPPIQLGWTGSGLPIARDWLIQLASQIPDWFHQCRQIFELIPQSESLRAPLREHYRLYQSQHIKPQHGSLSALLPHHR